MKATIENNRAALGLLAGLIVFVLGFVWWQFLYKPATVDNNAAMMANQTAQAALSDAQSRLTKAQQEVDAAKAENGGKFDDAVAKVQVARVAVPSKAQIDDALIVLEKYAKRSGIRTNWDISTENEGATSTDAAGTGDAKPVTIKVAAAGKWSELKSFIGYVESSASAERGELHVRGRIFNVVQIQVSTPDEMQATSSQENYGGVPTAEDELKLGKNEYRYELAIEMYTSDFGAAAAEATASSTTTPGATTTPGSTTTDATSGAAGGATTGTTPAPGSTSTPGATSSTGTTTTGTPGAGTSTTPGATPGSTATSGSDPTAGAMTPTGTAGTPSTTGVTG